MDFQGPQWELEEDLFEEWSPHLTGFPAPENHQRKLSLFEPWPGQRFLPQGHHFDCLELWFVPVSLWIAVFCGWTEEVGFLEPWGDDRDVAVAEGKEEILDHHHHHHLEA